MKEQNTAKSSAKVGATDWNRLRSLAGKDIRDAIEKDSEARPIPRPKRIITIRLDADVLDWLRRQKGYQTRIKAVLRTYMDAPGCPNAFHIFRNSAGEVGRGALAECEIVWFRA